MTWARRTSRWSVPALFLMAALLTGAQAARFADHALADPGLRAWLDTVYEVLRTGVTAAFAVFTIGRAAPRQPARSPVAFVACAVAMGTVLAFGPPPPGSPDAVVVAGEVLAVASCAWLLVSVTFLGRCFGVLPEARGLVARGPYGVVRHPVYLGEIGACLGLAIAAPTVGNAVALSAFVVAQSIRIALEERSLRAAFPQYESYALRVPCLVPLATRRSIPSHGVSEPRRSWDKAALAELSEASGPGDRVAFQPARGPEPSRSL
jgi:protein-S-isoprenylcysteine O-methyltransferase Ste14